MPARHGVTVLNSPGTVDADYRGEIGVLLINHGDAPFMIRRGERIAQMVIAPVIRVELVPAASLSATDRGSGGFRLDAAGRSLVISGDTRPAPALERLSDRVDVLVHEVYASETLKTEARPGGEDWPRYMHDAHTSDVELGADRRPRAAATPRARRTLIRMGAYDSTIVAGIRRGGFTGRVVIGPRR